MLHGSCYVKLLPFRFCVHLKPCSSLQCHLIQSHIRRVHACLAVICHLHFWQNDRDLLRATAVTRGWNRYRNESQHRKLTLEKNESTAAPAGTRTALSAGCIRVNTCITEWCTYALCACARCEHQTEFCLEGFMLHIHEA